MIYTIHTEMGHPQPTTPVQVYNSCADSIINGTMKQRRYKSIDILFYWLKYYEFQGKFHIHWRRGTDKLAN